MQQVPVPEGFLPFGGYLVNLRYIIRFELVAIDNVIHARLVGSGDELNYISSKP
jgi:hypothetical protein